jgi:glycosyltransferase involved in cell wall biosynthesis
VTSGLIFESAYAARVYRSRVRSKGAPQRVIPNGLKRMDFTLADPRPDATDVLFVGELRKIKGVDILLNALADLKLGHPVSATIVGSGPDAVRLKAMASALGLDGPRPHAVQAKAEGHLYNEVVEGYFARHKVKPGITGWAQINGWRGETDTEEKIRKRIEHDLYYIENWSVFLDLHILFKTPISLLNTKSAY